MNPFSNDSKPIKLNLIIIDSFISGDIDKNFGQFIYYGKAEKYSYYYPVPNYIHVSDLQFRIIKTKEEMNNYLSVKTIINNILNFAQIAAKFTVTNTR